MERAPITLGYANPIGDQPAGSAFTLTVFDDGIELSKPLRPDWLAAIAFGGVGVLTLAVVVGVPVHFAMERPRDRDPVTVLLPVMALLTAIAGHMLCYVWSVGRARTLTVTLRAGRLTARHAVWTVTGSTWVVRRPRRFTTTLSGFDVVGRRVLGTVLAQGRFGLGRAFLQGLPRDECLWITRLLNNAIPNGGAPHG